MSFFFIRIYHMKLLSKLFHFVALTSKKYSIDESHGLYHSMDVLQYADSIYQNEIKQHPQLIDQQRIIYISSILHDMCDKKYMNENEGIFHIESFLQDQITPEEIDITKKIISTMSYSTVKKNGFPELDNYQLAYHIVREADLLAAYDFDRAIIYNLQQMNGDIYTAYNNSIKLFENRVFTHQKDGLLTTEYAKKCDVELTREAYKKIEFWKHIMLQCN